MYQSTFRRRNIGPLTRYGRFNSRSFPTRRFRRGRYGYAYPTNFRYGTSRRFAHIGASRGFAGPHLTYREKKFLNTPLIAAGPANYPVVGDVLTNANVIGLNLLAEGTDYTNRISRKTHVKSIDLRMAVDAGSAPQPCWVRTMIVYDMQPNGAVPAITDILDTTTVPLEAVQAPMNLNNRDRFRVVIDRLQRLDTTSFETVEVKKFKLCDYETIYNASTAGVATITSGALWFFSISNNPTGTGAPLIKLSQSGVANAAGGMVRIRFIDG